MVWKTLFLKASSSDAEKSRKREKEKNKSGKVVPASHLIKISPQVLADWRHALFSALKAADDILLRATCIPCVNYSQALARCPQTELMISVRHETSPSVVVGPVGQLSVSRWTVRCPTILLRVLDEGDLTAQKQKGLAKGAWFATLSLEAWALHRTADLTLRAGRQSCVLPKPETTVMLPARCFGAGDDLKTENSYWVAWFKSKQTTNTATCIECVQHTHTHTHTERQFGMLETGKVIPNKLLQTSAATGPGSVHRTGRGCLAEDSVTDAQWHMANRHPFAGLVVCS
ncbi:hypothetical protein RRG08_024597 [Elysia crispata]|uniref:Uncharacterized protein n=1 Tax=Elysia crispata TaxID=231223 RepID=A0AAE1DNW5_9GAST|nr:hypothetical protein RRG08_024597 [Elysia crispata]